MSLLKGKRERVIMNIRTKERKQNAQHSMLLLLLFIITNLAFSNSLQAKDKSYPGKLINIGTHRLHINCIGQGMPTVIIDSGIGGFSLEWFKIQNNLSDDVRICSYDRAGYGWSDPGPKPRTTARIAKELRTLLVEAKIPGPYLLVGHSFGGYNIRYFASEYPEMTAGLVLIDSSHPQQFNTEEFKRVEPKAPVTKHRNSVSIRLIRPIIADNYPHEKKRVAYQLMSSMKSINTLMNEMDFMEISAQQLAARNHQRPHNFPVVIITRGKRVWPDNELGDRRERQWSKLQNDLENISLNSDHFLAYKSGHIVHLDQPELVSENILLAVNKSRAQLLEKELIKKFDIRQASYSTTPSFAGSNLVFSYNKNKINALLIPNRSLPEIMFHTKSDYFENLMPYFQP
jgi:pimeloyl-ACP methyl ester carboxylesterase